MPLPFQCIYCGKHVKEPMNGVCKECKENKGAAHAKSR